MVGNVGGGERELPYFKLYEVLREKGEHANKDIGYKERTFRLNDLSRISFGLEKLRPFVFNNVKFEMPCCEVELEGHGRKEGEFPLYPGRLPSP